MLLTVHGAFIDSKSKEMSVVLRLTSPTAARQSFIKLFESQKMEAFLKH